jgi:hypothetical protein
LAGEREARVQSEGRSEEAPAWWRLVTDRQIKLVKREMARGQQRNLDEMETAGLIALCEAAKEYDTALPAGVLWETFVLERVRAAVTKARQHGNNTIRGLLTPKGYMDEMGVYPDPEAWAVAYENACTPAAITESASVTPTATPAAVRDERCEGGPSADTREAHAEPSGVPERRVREPMADDEATATTESNPLLQPARQAEMKQAAAVRRAEKARRAQERRRRQRERAMARAADREAKHEARREVHAIVGAQSAESPERNAARTAEQVRAAEALRQLLADGPLEADAVLERVVGAGISLWAARKAAQKLGLQKTRDGGTTGQWIWALPADGAASRVDDVAA